MAAAARSIAAFVEGFDFERFAATRLVRSAVERELEIISEASRHLPKTLKSRHADVPWRGMADFGNWTRHAYHHVDGETVWRIATVDVPALLVVVEDELPLWKADAIEPVPYPTFEDFRPGEIVTYGRHVVTRDDIIAYAADWDPQPMHLDEEAGKASILKGLAASGWHSCGILMRLNVDHMLANSTSMGAPGVEELKWLKPVYPGDTLSVRREVLEARPSASRPEMGVVRFKFELLNQRGEPVLEQVGPVFFGLRSPGGRAEGDR